MIKQIIGLIIGILVLLAGIYYLIKEKNDAQSKKIYTVISVIGAIITVACIVMLVL